MAIYLIGKIKPKNEGTFALMDAADIEMEDGTRLEAYLDKLSTKVWALEEGGGSGGTGAQGVGIVSITIVEVGAKAEKLATPVIRLEADTEDPTGLTPAILGVAVLGRTILGSYDGSLPKLTAPVISLESVSEDTEEEPALTKLDAPVIRLEADQEDAEEEPMLTKLDAPVISLETVVMVLDAPEIQLVEV